MTKKSNPKELTVQNLIKNDKYIIPLYQRDYDWGEEHITQLIRDISDKQKEDQNSTYYIGTLIVNYNKSGYYEVIDGQQRLTTLWILLAALKNGTENDKINLDFECRESAKETLEALYKKSDDGLIDNEYTTIKTAYKICKNYIANNGINNDGFKTYLLKNVKIIRVTLPENTDLNHYFEIMNTRGEQLEKHEILKYKFITQITAESDKKTFSAIWDMCSDMDTHIQEHFFKNESSTKNNNFIGLGNSDDVINENWSSIEKKRKNTQPTSKEEQTNQDTEKKSGGTFLDAIKKKPEEETKTKEEDENSEAKYKSIINFPNFLLQVLKVIRLNSKNTEQAEEKQNPKSVILNDQKLLDTFEEGDFEKWKQFALKLLKLRLLFDKYVIKGKNDMSDESWVLNKRKKQEKEEKYYYVNTFPNAEEDESNIQKQIIMILSMFHVSFPGQSHKNWLTGVLKFLDDNKSNSSPTSQEYLEYLERLNDQIFFNHFINEKNYDDIISENPEPNKREFTKIDEKKLNLGTNTPHYFFNRLDYLIWKNYQKKNETKNDDEQKLETHINSFRFTTTRNSVEHFFPRNPKYSDPENDPKKENIDHFGNLCLMNSSFNQSLSNKQPQEKAKEIIDWKNNRRSCPSLKLLLMANIAKNPEQWGDNEIENHQKEMQKLLFNPEPANNQS
jgi:uncharacterized protein with ParB-like and HNH nuclease domain